MALHQITKNFHYIEFASKDGAKLPKELEANLVELVQNLQVLREYVGKKITINSGYRSPEHNEKIGGVKESFHVRAMAADIVVEGHTPKQVKEIIQHLILTGRMKEGGIGLYDTFVHYDVRGTKARW